MGTLSRRPGLCALPHLFDERRFSGNLGQAWLETGFHALLQLKEHLIIYLQTLLKM